MSDMGLKARILLVLYLTSIVTATSNHEPKVHEELNEDLPQIVRTSRHLGSNQNIYRPPVFNYRNAPQQDRMRAKYHRQQLVDFKRFKFETANPDALFEKSQYQARNRGTTNIPFKETSSEWEPFQPEYMTLPKVKSNLKITKTTGKNRFSELKKDKNVIHDNSFENDLDTAGSQIKNETVRIDRKDQDARYIYVQPSILKNNFGLDTKTTEKILKNVSPQPQSPHSDELQIAELQELLGKNPEYQLQGLQQILEEAGSFKRKPSEEETHGIDIKHNGSPRISSNPPPIDDLQQQLDAVNKAHANAALVEAHKQAEAHVLAQHKALELAQQRAQEEAFKKIAAHNKGVSTLRTHDYLQTQDSTQSPHQNSVVHQIEQNSIDPQPTEVEDVDGSQTLALRARPYEEILLAHPPRNGEGSASSYSDLRDNKPTLNNIPLVPIHDPAPFIKTFSGPPHLQQVTAIPEVNYVSMSASRTRLANKNVQKQKTSQIYSPVSTRPIFEQLPSLQDHSHQVTSLHAAEPHLFSNQNDDYARPKFEQLPSLQDHSSEQTKIALPHTATVHLYSKQNDERIRPTSEHLPSLQDHSPQKIKIALPQTATVHLYSKQNNERIRPTSEHLPSLQDHSPQQTKIALPHTATVHLYSKQNDEYIRPISGHLPSLQDHSSQQKKIALPPTATAHLYSKQNYEHSRPTSGHLPSLQDHSPQQIKIASPHKAKPHLYSKHNDENYDDLSQYAEKYAFGYRILDEKHGNDFGHEEERDEKLTKGHYYVVLPDGRRQKVEYFVDKSGYHAEVSYENMGRHHP